MKMVWTYLIGGGCCKSVLTPLSENECAPLTRPGNIYEL